MFQIVLFQPEIPPNTGNVIRLAANTGCRLHLVEPLGFDVGERSLRRAGLDYHEFVALQVHPDWSACRAALGDTRLFAFTTKGGTRFDKVAYQPNDSFIFGQETAGLPADMLALFPESQRVRLPMMPGNRSLNLSNAVAVAVFTAWQQLDCRGSV